MLDLKNNDILLKMREQLVQEVKVEVKDMNNEIKQIKIEVKTNNEINKVNKQQPVREIRRGDIYYVNLGSDRRGSLQKNIRPWIILSNNLSNRYSSILNGCSITSQLDKTDLPVHVRIKGHGLMKESVVLAETVESIDKKSQLLTYVGHVDEATMMKIDKAIKIQLGELVQKTPLERLPKQIKDVIEDKLEGIQDCERVIARFTTKSLVNKLLSERSDLLYSLQIYCEDNGLNYKDYYVIYKKEKRKEEEMIAI
jgi:mRNA interferase MazF